MKNVIKIISLAMLFTLIAPQAYSQKCKFDYQKKDQITGEETKGNSVNIYSKSMSLVPKTSSKISFNKIGETYYFEIIIDFHGVVRDIIQKGDAITFKLSNGEVITIYAQNEIIPSAQVIAGERVMTRYKGKYDIDAATLQKIAENMPTFIRANVGSTIYEEEIAVGCGKKIIQAATCILQ